MSDPTRRWRRARLLKGTALPAGTECWVRDSLERLPQRLTRVAPGRRWSLQFGPDDFLLRTHFILPTGEPLYCPLSHLELLADGRDDVELVDLLTMTEFRRDTTRVRRGST